jgi:hypothetical protein
MRLSPPAKWNKEIDGLDLEEFRRRQKEHLLPPGTVSPRRGQVWEAVQDCEVYVAAYFSTRWPQASRALLQRGERVHTEDVYTARLPAWVDFQPVRYEELHAIMVPEEIRQDSGHTYYYLHVPLVKSSWFGSSEPTFFTESFRLVETGA